MSCTRDVSLKAVGGTTSMLIGDEYIIPTRRVYYETVNSVGEVDYSTITFDSPLSLLQKQ